MRVELVTLRDKTSVPQTVYEQAFPKLQKLFEQNPTDFALLAADATRREFGFASSLPTSLLRKHGFLRRNNSRTDVEAVIRNAVSVSIEGDGYILQDPRQ